MFEASTGLLRRTPKYLCAVDGVLQSGPTAGWAETGLGYWPTIRGWLCWYAVNTGEGCERDGVGVWAGVNGPPNKYSWPIAWKGSGQFISDQELV